MCIILKIMFLLLLNDVVISWLGVIGLVVETSSDEIDDEKSNEEYKDKGEN